MKLPNSAARSLGIVRREFGASTVTTPSNTSRAVWTLSNGSTWEAQSFFPRDNKAGLLEVPCDPGARRKLCDIPASGTRYPRSTWCECKYGKNNPLSKLCFDVAKRYDPWTSEGRAEMQLLANNAGFTEFNPFDSVGAMRDASADLKWRGLREPPLPKTVSTDRYAAIVWPKAGQLEQCMPPCGEGATRQADGSCKCNDPSWSIRGEKGKETCFPPCANPNQTRDDSGSCVDFSREIDVSGCPPGTIRAAGGLCIPLDLAFPDRQCPPGTVEQSGGKCFTLPSTGVTPVCKNRFGVPTVGLVYVPGLGCVPREQVPCTDGFYRDPTTKNCTRIQPCGDEEPDRSPGSGDKFKLDMNANPPKCVPRCPPGQRFSREAGYVCVPDPKQKQEGGILAQLLLGAGAGLAVGGPVGAGIGAIAAVALFGKK